MYPNPGTPPEVTDDQDQLMLGYKSGEEWRAKLSWLVAMLWYKVHNMSESFIEEMLQVVRPARDGVIDVTSEKQSVLDCQHHLQNGLFEVLHKLAGFWLDGKTGKEYVETLQDERLSKVKLSKLKLLDVEDWLELGPRVSVQDDTFGKRWLTYAGLLCHLVSCDICDRCGSLGYRWQFR